MRVRASRRRINNGDTMRDTRASRSVRDNGADHRAPAYRVDCARRVYIVRMGSSMTRRYLSAAEVAHRIGVKPATLTRYKLPAPDALVGKIRGWTVETIDAWNAARPGPGWHGPRR